MTAETRAVLKRAAAVALFAMWLCQEIKLLTGGGVVVAYAGASGFLVYSVAATLSARSSQRWVIALISGSAIGIALYYRIPSTLLSGIESAVLFAAFLATMQMLRVALEASPRMGHMRRQFAMLASAQRHDSTLLRSHLIASVIGAGAIAVLAPLIAPDESKARRREFAQTSLQGIGLAVLWSPFFVAMAVCTRFVQDVGLATAVLNGLVMATLGLLLSHFLYGASVSSLTLAPMRSTFAEVGALATAIIFATRVWGLSSLEAVVLGIPLLSLWIARDQMIVGATNVHRRWFASLESITVEVLIVGAALVLGEVLNQLLVLGLIAIPHGADAWPVPLLLALPPLLMLGTSLLGLHPIVSASCFLPLLTSISKLHGNAIIGSVLLGWMLCLVLSRFVVSVMYAAAAVDVPQRDLVQGRNLRFCAYFVPLALFYLWALNTVLGYGI